MSSRPGGQAARLDRAGVTEREAEVLAAIAERLRNREIADRMHISVRTVESHIAALLRKLGVTDRAALVELGAGAGRTAHPALPVPLTSLIGRERETGELVALLDAHRLITLTGPAGAGKTRLALHLATLRAGHFPDGARLADLTPVAGGLVADTLAGALGVGQQPGRPLRDRLREAARDTACLLLVDNCEHVIAEAAELVADLLAAGGRLRVLATSRELLGIPGEVSYQLPPLPVPTPRASPRAATAGSYDAVRLFVDRAGRGSPGFALTDANAPAVAALCRRLDGLPLAIELAAARVRSFGPAELVAHLDQRFALLSGGARTVLPRHRTLRHAIDWSYELLDADERALFDRLGAFPADFDYEAVEAVCGNGADGVDRATPVIELLPRLVDKSLVSTTGGRTVRYRLLETIRAYAAERLATRGGEAAVHQRHAAHYLALAELAARRLRGPDQRVWLDRLTTEQPNLRAGLEHCAGTGDIETMLRWIAALRRFWDDTGQRREGHDWIRRTLAMGDPPDTPAAVAGLTAASALLDAWDDRAALDVATQAVRHAADLGDFERATAALAVGSTGVWLRPDLALPALHEALDRFGDDHPWERALTLQILGLATVELAEALGYARASVALFRRVGDQLYAANTLYIMAQRSIGSGIASDEVHGWLIESLALSEAAGSTHDRVHALIGLGQLAWLRDDHERAAQLVEECLPTLRLLGDQRCTGRALHLLGERAYEQRQLAGAEELLRGSVAAVALSGNGIVLVNALETLAAVLHAQDRPHHAAVLLGAAQAQRESTGPLMRPVRPPDEAVRRSLLRTLGEAAFGAGFGQGRLLSPAEALQLTSAGPARTSDPYRNP